MHTARGIIVAVQVGAVKIYVAASEDAQAKRKKGETQKSIKIDGPTPFPGPRVEYRLMYFFAGFF
jgi:hypothetical protein